MASPTPQIQRAKVSVRSTSDIKNPNISVAYFGREKTGKTHNAISWPGPIVVNFSANMATLTKHKGVPYIEPGGAGADPKDRINAWHQDILPMIQNRQLTEWLRDSDPQWANYTVRTVVVDDYTSMGGHFRHVLTSGGRSKMEFEEWARYLNWMSNDTDILIGATHSSAIRPDLESYNVVVTVHENHILGKEGKLVKIVPMVEGQYKDQLLSKFDFVLVTDSTTDIISDKKSPDYGKKRARYFVHTVPPDSYRKAGGSHPQSLVTLPPQLVGTYPELAKAWGLPTEPA